MKTTLYVIGIVWFALMTVTSLTSGERSDSSIVGLIFLAACSAGLYRHRRQTKIATAQANELQRKANDLLDAMNDGAMPVMVASKVRTKTGEVVRYAAPAELLKNQTTGYRASTAGASLRIAKGLTVRTGGIRGGAIKEVVAIAKGELAMLDKRLVFAGDLKSFEYPYDSLTHVEKLQDGLIIHHGSSAHIIRIRASQPDVIVAHAVLDRLLAAAA